MARVIEMLDRAISRAGDGRNVGAIGDLLKGARRELAGLLEDEPVAEPYISGREIPG